mgnify:CR=1 FL=1
MKRILMTTAAALTVAFPAFAQTPAAGGSEATPKWDVQNPIGAQRDVNINVDEGTWMALDVSPDGREIIFDLLGDICATSPALAAHLARHPEVLDGVLAGHFFAPWPGAAGLREALDAQLQSALTQPAGGYEVALDAARRWAHEWQFRVGVHHLRGLIEAEEAGQHYADVADAAVAALAPVVAAEFARRHGPPPGAGAVVLGMGSLGARQLNASSDLDLIVIYDPLGAETSEGPKPLATRSYYARLTQALITALAAPMAEGRLYEVDMRLRPSGRQGPVATSIESFRAYQMDEAWTWEHLALTRARVVWASSSQFAEAAAGAVESALRRPRDRARTAADVRDMRALLERARGIAHRLVLEALVPAAVGRAVVVVVGPLGQLIEVGHQERVGHAAARAAPSSAGC